MLFLLLQLSLAHAHPVETASLDLNSELAPHNHFLHSIRLEEVHRDIIGFEQRLWALNLRVHNFHSLNLSFDQALPPPQATVLSGRDETWRELFGQNRLSVFQSDLVDTSKRHTASKEFSTASLLRRDYNACADLAPNEYHSQVDLRPWVPIHDRAQTSAAPTLYVNDSPDTRHVMLGLQPGESAMVVEIMETPKERLKHAHRRITVRRANEETSVREYYDSREFCVSLVAPQHRDIQASTSEPDN